MPRVPPASAPGPSVSASAAERVFTAALAVSAARCLLTYVALPFVAPAVGVAADVGPWLGVSLAGVGITANVVSVRRFWSAAHRWRWHFSVLAGTVIVFLAVFIAGDIAELVG
jgi:hypothetical protein